MPRSTCTVPKCDSYVKANGFCSKHYSRWRRHGHPGKIPQHRRLCTLDQCNAPAHGGGLCKRHYQRRERSGDPHVVRKAQNDRPIGTRRIRPGQPYVQVKVCLAAEDPIKCSGWRKEHRVVMERLIGRELLPEETVHHKNGNHTDNRESNLELWSSRHPKGQRVADLVEWANEIIGLYGAEVNSTLPT